MKDQLGIIKQTGNWAFSNRGSTKNRIRYEVHTDEIVLVVSDEVNGHMRNGFAKLDSLNEIAYFGQALIDDLVTVIPMRLESSKLLKLCCK